jgi:hypothetical protein
VPPPNRHRPLMITSHPGAEVLSHSCGQELISELRDPIVDPVIVNACLSNKADREWATHSDLGKSKDPTGLIIVISEQRTSWC